MLFALFLLPYTLEASSTFGAEFAIDRDNLPEFQESIDKSDLLNEIFDENNVRYRLIDEGPGKSRKVPIACVQKFNKYASQYDLFNYIITPKNQFFANEFFTYKCTEKEDGKLGLEHVGCRNLIAGEQELASNGTVKRLCQIVKGEIREIVENVRGCFYNGTVYRVGETWMEKNPNESDVKHLLMECYKSETGYFDKKIVGCGYQEIHQKLEFTNGTTLWKTFTDTVDHFENATVTRENKLMRTRTLGQYRYRGRKIYEKCEKSEIKEGEVTWKRVEKTELKCKRDRIMDFWKDEKRAGQFYCQDDKIHKNGCILNKKQILIGGTRKLTNGCTFLCHPLKNVYYCENRLDGLEIDRKKQKTQKSLILKH